VISVKLEEEKGVFEWVWGGFAWFSGNGKFVGVSGIVD
jgi:hypothetical protein